MKNKKILLSTIILGTVAFSGVALAEHHDGGHKGGHKGAKHFEKIDTNADGKISLDEHLASAKERFTKMDQDKDGFVTKEEAQELKKNMREKMKEMKDKRQKAETASE